MTNHPNRSRTDGPTIRWTRIDGGVEWTIEGGDWLDPYTMHCNRYATFKGPASGQNWQAHQTHGWASTVWAETDAEVSRLLRREFKARSVRRSAAAISTKVSAL
jgi:hypothetical protein